MFGRNSSPESLIAPPIKSKRHQPTLKSTLRQLFKSILLGGGRTPRFPS